MIALLALATALGADPGDQALIWYNARMALREDEPVEAVKLWLLRNAVEDQTGMVSPNEADFRSVTWAALGDLGLCPDGAQRDDDGAGLWPIAMHNWVTLNMKRRPRKDQRPFKAFELGRQARRIAVGDVLSAEELGSLELASRRCLLPRALLIEIGESPLAKMSDPEIAVELLSHLLDRAQGTVDDDVVYGTAVIAARRFDLRLQLMAIAAREAELEARRRARRGREIGLSRTSVATMNETAPEYTFTESSVPGRILRAAATWPPGEWMALTPQRRLFLYDRARAFGGDPAVFDRIALGVADALIEANDGAEAEKWIARVLDPAARETIWGGDRGRRLLALDPEAGFQERGVIALHRGVDHLARGELRDALRALSFALAEAPDSRASEETLRLSRRWLSYTMAQYESTSELLITLQELVPARDYAMILEDLMWRAALRADLASYQRGTETRTSRVGAALDRRLKLLQPLAAGDVDRFTRSVEAGLVASPSETLRFLDLLVEQIELEEADVRAAHLVTLDRIDELVVPLTAPQANGSPGRQGRAAAALLDRIQAIQEGQVGLGPDASVEDRARALAPTGEVFAGSVRLAPSDPLPWPFVPAVIAPPPVFEPIDLTPREWRGADGVVVFGWSIGG